MVTANEAATTKMPKLSFLRVFRVFFIPQPYINQVNFLKTRDKPRVN